MPDHDYGAIVSGQAEALRTLADGRERREWLQRVAGRRKRRRRTGDPGDPATDFPIVPLSLVEVTRQPWNHSGLVPVVADEIVVRFTNAIRDRATDLLERAGFERIDDDLPDDARCCADHARYVGDPDKVGAVLLQLRASRVMASHGAAVMLADTVKGPNDPKPAMSDGLDPYSAAGGIGANAPVVIVIDTGLEPDTHRAGWLNANDVTALNGAADHDPVNTIDNATGDTTPDDKIDPGAGHGTFVAGVVRRVAPAAKVVMLRAADSEGFASDGMVAAAICQAAAYIGKDGRGVVNLSLGGETPDNLIPPVVECALRKLPENAVVVAAAGNEPTGVPVWPAASKRVVSVAALDVDEQPADWSNFGSTIDFSVRGEGIVSTFVQGTDDDGDTYDPDDYGIWSGTSFAAPQVTAAIALRMEDPKISAAAALQSLRDDGEYVPGWGYVLRDDDITLHGGSA